MKIICAKEYEQTLNDLLKPYMSLPLVLVQQNLEFKHPAIYFKPSELNEVIEILESLQPTSLKLLGEKDGKWFPLEINEIIFIEGLSRDTFAYTNNDSYRIKERVSNLEDTWINYDFIRINKSMIVNTRHIQYILPTFASKLILHLSNDIEVEVSRTYAKEFKKKMKVKP